MKKALINVITAGIFIFAGLLVLKLATQSSVWSLDRQSNRATRLLLILMVFFDPLGLKPYGKRMNWKRTPRVGYPVFYRVNPLN